VFVLTLRTACLFGKLARKSNRPQFRGILNFQLEERLSAQPSLQTHLIGSTYLCASRRGVALPPPKAVDRVTSWVLQHYLDVALISATFASGEPGGSGRFINT
jgi:hypothetical protein